MHTLFLNYHYDEDLTTVASLLERYHSSKDWCEAVAKQGGEISYFQRFRYTDHQTINGVDYYFINDNLPPRLSWYRNPKTFHKEIIKLKPDVIHYNGQIFHLKYLRPLLPKETAVVWQYHGNGKWTQPFFKQIVYSLAFSQLDGFMFSSIEQVEEWRKASLIQPQQSAFEIIAASTLFSTISRGQLQGAVKLQGSEIFLWLGRLNVNKDPLTVLRGFARSLNFLKDPHLYMIYSETGLVEDVRRAIISHGLSDRVHLVGKVTHDELPKYYSGADYFVLGSHHEGTGFALIEAIGCGSIPIVTDIPSFRKITGNGTIGYLWSAGDPDSFSSAIQRAQSKIILRDFVTSYFKENLSYEHLGGEALSIYQQVWQKRQSLLRTV